MDFHTNKNRRSHRSQKQSKQITLLSQRLSEILRHTARDKHGLTMTRDGYVPVSELVDKNIAMSSRDIRRAIQINKKRRFSIAYLSPAAVYNPQNLIPGRRRSRTLSSSGDSVIPTIPPVVLQNENYDERKVDGLIMCIRAKNGHSIKGIDLNSSTHGENEEDDDNDETEGAGTYRRFSPASDYSSTTPLDQWEQEEQEQEENLTEKLIFLKRLRNSTRSTCNNQEKLSLSPPWPEVIQEHGTDALLSDPDTMIQSIKICGIWAFQYVSEQLQSDRYFLLQVVGTIMDLPKATMGANNEKAISIDSRMEDFFRGGLLPTKIIQSFDQQLVLDMVRKTNGLVLQYLPAKWKDNKEVVLVAVSKSGSMLRHVSMKLRNHRDVVMKAVNQDGNALQYASDNLRNNKRIVLTSLKRQFPHNPNRRDQDAAAAALAGSVLQYASKALRSDKEVVRQAVSKNPEALKYALGGLNQDEDCWIAAKLWDKKNKRNSRKITEQDHCISLTTTTTVRVPLSTRFAMDEQSESSVIQFTYLIQNAFKHFQFHGSSNNDDKQLVLYSPNAFNKSSCDPEWTNAGWPCRGTLDTCRFLLKQEDALTVGKPTDRSCWRYSYRYHLEQAKATNGFMLQVVDYDQSTASHQLGNGQEIEMMMAQDVGTKVFRICQPVAAIRRVTKTTGGKTSVGGGAAEVRYERADFTKRHINMLMARIKKWYTRDHCKDKVGLEIQFWKYDDCGNRQSWIPAERRLQRGTADVESLCRYEREQGTARFWNGDSNPLNR